VTGDHWIARAFCKVLAFLRGPADLRRRFREPPTLGLQGDDSVSRTARRDSQHNGSLSLETTITTKPETIRALNDELRQNLTVGTAFITAGVAALGADAVARIVRTIAVYDNFCHANDPYEEHDIGSFDLRSMVRRSFSRSINYDKALASHSPDPTDPSVTERVITIMLAEEY
jgi:hypothetical protein